ncbi:hypothetical protein [Bradyrhizobium sp. S3.2.12]|uniref:hypothetical protein n=1 Tax=Bradyrhizobium sp. S3.2.12 TaxID=3156387 RepID=UPI00339A504E
MSIRLKVCRGPVRLVELGRPALRMISTRQLIDIAWRAASLAQAFNLLTLSHLKPYMIAERRAHGAIGRSLEIEVGLRSFGRPKRISLFYAARVGEHVVSAEGERLLETDH